MSTAGEVQPTDVANGTERPRRPARRDRRHTAAEARRPAPSSRRSLAARAVIAVAAVSALVAFGRQAGEGLPGFVDWVRNLGPWAPGIFVATYALGVLAFVPGAVMTAAAGAIFGVGQGTALVLLGATLGATGAFGISRRLARGAVSRWIRRDARFAAIDEAVRCQGFRIVFLLRLSPILPFNLLNYGLGATRVRLRDYIMASIGMLPGTLLYVYSGRIAGELVTTAAEGGAERGPGYYGVLALGFAATVLVTVLITRAARQALREVADV